MTEEEKLAQNPMYNDESCKVVQAAAAKAGYNLMCAGDEEQVDVVLPGGEECEKQVQVLSKYGMTAVCDETDDAVAEAASKAKAAYEAQEECDKPLVIDDAKLCDTDEAQDKITTFADMMSDDLCKYAQDVAEKFGMNITCPSDENEPDMVLPGGEGCEKQVKVLSKYGVTAVCDDAEGEVAAMAARMKAEAEDSFISDVKDFAEGIGDAVEDVIEAVEEKVATFTDMMDDEACKRAQDIAEKFGMNIMCPSDEEEPDMVLPGGEGCEKQVKVLSKYGVTAVCDEV